MWCLTSENDNRVIYIVSSNQIVIGRNVDNQVCNFAIPNDASISRRHVTLAVIDNELFLQDLGSRYGTFVNSNKAEHNVNIKLQEDDVVKFGKINSIWKVKVIDLITCTSTLKGENLQNLKLTISKINGILKGDWDDTCNYLTMPAITLTIKVVLALVQGSDIVTVDFWNKCLENVTNFKALPDPTEYLPKIVESTLNKEVVSFLPDSRRKALFKGKKFVFFSKRQHEMYKNVLIKSGATPMLLSECRMTTSMLCAENVIVIQYIATGTSQESQTQKKTINDIVVQLKNKGKRVVADAEIGLAILYCSLDKYCNPNFSFTSEVVKQTSAPVKDSKVLAPESQDSASEQKKENVVIDESLMSEEQANGHSNKRKFSEEGQVNANKKLATSCLVANIKTESVKRRLSDDDKSVNPTKKVAMDKENNSEILQNPPETVDNDSSDVFNFVKTGSTNNTTGNKVKKLNLARPQKRKMNDNNEDENLFNFVQSEVQNSQEVKSDTNNTFKQNFSIFNLNKKKNDSDDAVEEKQTIPKIQSLTADEISAMRGSKLKELMELNSNALPTLKKEKSEELEEQMNKLDLCCTIVTACNNLIVKREQLIETDISVVHNTSLKNFKKFKKVWPIRRSINASSINFSDNTVA
ncbi:unnamed protein product [Spodoptera littoralis]|uniref:FHA domain-containing protein n=1 Tax=Spodoptera littoralis TaxID=7109 RepID=A0A9P0N8S1_SPOLI|nr:unnamed protein product [Spodoptera littoralis]CAH1645546.1 unnamed protein product [Spodoptera littoralis]